MGPKNFQRLSENVPRVPLKSKLGPKGLRDSCVDLAVSTNPPVPRGLGFSFYNFVFPEENAKSNVKRIVRRKIFAAPYLA